MFQTGESCWRTPTCMKWKNIYIFECNTIAFPNWVIQVMLIHGVHRMENRERKGKYVCHWLSTPGEYAGGNVASGAWVIILPSFWMGACDIKSAHWHRPQQRQWGKRKGKEGRRGNVDTNHSGAGGSLTCVSSVRWPCGSCKAGQNGMKRNLSHLGMLHRSG